MPLLAFFVIVCFAAERLLSACVGRKCCFCGLQSPLTAEAMPFLFGRLCFVCACVLGGTMYLISESPAFAASNARANLEMMREDVSCIKNS